MHRSRPQEASVPVVAALLAGGSSRRMGTDKTVALLGGRPLAHWAAATLAATSRFRVQAGGGPIPGIHWPILADHRQHCGPAAGIESALLAYPGCSVIVCAVDSPFVPPGLLLDCLDELDELHLAAVPRTDARWHPLIAAYSPAFLPPLQTWLESGRRDLQRLIDETPSAPIDGARLSSHGHPEAMLMNINTPEQLEAASRWLARIDHL